MDKTRRNSDFKFTQSAVVPGRAFWRYLFLFIGFVIPFAQMPVYARDYILARAPQRSAVKMSQAWNQFIDALRRESGVRIRLKLYNERIAFERDLKNGTPDFAFGNPAYLIVANQRHGYLPILRSDKTLLKGIVVVRRDSAIKKLSDLNGSKIVFPGKHAFAASLYLRALLGEAGLKYIPVYVNGHDNVYRNVASGNFIAGGGVYRTLAVEKGQLMNQLRVVYETPGIRPHPLIVRPDVPLTIVHRVRDAILKMWNTPDGRTLLTKIKLEKPVTADFNRDYSAIKKISLKAYLELLE